MIILIDGPENSGKTTVAKAIGEWMESMDGGGSFVYVKQSGRALPDENIYIPQLYSQAVDKTKMFVWDRGWPSEFVYGRILDQDRPLAKNPFLGYWKFDRIVQSAGLGVILSGENLAAMDEMRSDEDIQTTAADERALFEDYADTFGLLKIRNDFSEKSVDYIVHRILQHFVVSIPTETNGDDFAIDFVPFEVGNKYAKTAFITETDPIAAVTPFESDGEFFQKNFPIEKLVRSKYLALDSERLNEMKNPPRQLYFLDEIFVDAESPALVGYFQKWGFPIKILEVA